MKQPDFDKAFAPTPEIVSLCIEDAIRKGEKAMKFRHKITALLSAAAVLAIVCAAAVFALPSEPRPDVVSQPKLVELTEEPTVYYTSKGVYYHNIEDCSGMMNANPHPLSEAQSDGKIACPVCVEPDSRTQASIMDAPVYYNTNGTWYHYEEHCSGMMNAKPHTYFEAKADGKEPCPTCVGEWVFGFEGAPETTAAPELCESSVTMDESGTVLLAESRPVPTKPTAEPAYYDWNFEPVYEETEVAYSEEDVQVMMKNLEARTPADEGADVFLSVFGVHLFDAFRDYEYQSTKAHGFSSDDGVQTEDFEFLFGCDVERPVIVTIESRDGLLMSGLVCLRPPKDFNLESFCENASPWFQATCGAAAEILKNTGGSGEQFAIKQVYTHFDSVMKPSVCVLDCEVSSGFITLSFDISDDEITLASVHYDVSKA